MHHQLWDASLWRFKSENSCGSLVPRYQSMVVCPRQTKVMSQNIRVRVKLLEDFYSF